MKHNVINIVKTVHLIQHTHWDREWYFTDNDSQALLYYFMADLMSKLEQDLELGPFILDAQTVIIDDYLEIAPDQKDRLVALIQSGRILNGPWYSQTDFLIVGAESITRNLLYGTRRAQLLGPVMKVGYVPDSFGQTAQLPMFLNQFDIHAAVFWRGWSEYNVDKTEFIWYGVDGSKVITAVLPKGYGCAKWLPTEATQAMNKVIAVCEDQSSFNHSSHLLLPNGNDQSPFESLVPNMLQQLNILQDQYYFKRSDFLTFLNEVYAENSNLKSYTGEFLSPKYMRIHRGIFSTRMDIKIANATLEHRLAQQLEPLLTINWVLGLPYPEKAIEKIWLQAMKSHPHDSIGGCNSDRVNQIVLNRLLSGLEMTDQLIELNLRKLCEGIQSSQQGCKLILFNAFPHQYSGYVALTIYTPETNFNIVDHRGRSCSYQIIDEQSQDMSTIIQELSNQTEQVCYRKLKLLLIVNDVPASGYTTYYLQQGVQGCPVSMTHATGRVTDGATDAKQRKQTIIENQWLRLTLTANNCLDLFDKRNNKDYKNQFIITDEGDEGDNYNFSPLGLELNLNSKTVATKYLTSWSSQCSDLSSSLILNYLIPVPESLEERVNSVADHFIELIMTIRLFNNLPQLEVDIELDNQIKDHRLQIHFPINIICDHHFADQPFGLIRRDNRSTQMDLWQKEQWTEAPVSLYPMQSLVSINDGDRGVAVVTKGLREYEISVSDTTNVIAITLLRSVGWLGKPDLVYRPGRASGMNLPSPDSQIQGLHKFKLCLIPQIGDMNQSDFWKQVEHWRTPLFTHLDTNWARFKIAPHGLKFNEQLSLFRAQSALMFSGMKKAENEDAIVLRSYNPTMLVQDFRNFELIDLSNQHQWVVYQSTLAETKESLVPKQKVIEVPSCAPLTLLLCPNK